MVDAEKMRKHKMAQDAQKYLSLPYSFLVVPDETGGYSAQVVEFPGCFAEGDSFEEAVKNLEDAARTWITLTLEKGGRIPPPIGNSDHSGKFALRMPKSLHNRLAHTAFREGVSINQFIVAALSEHLGVVETRRHFERSITARLTTAVHDTIAANLERDCIDFTRESTTASSGNQNRVSIH